MAAISGELQKFRTNRWYRKWFTGCVNEQSRNWVRANASSTPVRQPNEQWSNLENRKKNALLKNYDRIKLGQFRNNDRQVSKVSYSTTTSYDLNHSIMQLDHTSEKTRMRQCNRAVAYDSREYWGSATHFHLQRWQWLPIITITSWSLSNTNSLSLPLIDRHHSNLSLHISGQIFRSNFIGNIWYSTMITTNTTYFVISPVIDASRKARNELL